MPKFAFPVVNRGDPLRLLIRHKVFQHATHTVHLRFGPKIEAGIAGVLVGFHRCNDGFSDGAHPAGVRGGKVCKWNRARALTSQPFPELVTACQKRFAGKLVRLQKDFVARGLIGPKTCFLVHDKRGHQGRRGDIVVSDRHALDGALSIEDLPGEGTGDQGKGHHRHQQSLQQDAIELIQVHSAREIVTPGRDCSAYQGGPGRLLPWSCTHLLPR